MAEDDDEIIPEEGHDDAYPEEKVSQKEKARHSPYRRGGGKRSERKSRDYIAKNAISLHS